jgi:predicted unusual protein kinase regulating ubiquinone biosynthesis (AarF/ABC1/UbiB family)
MKNASSEPRALPVPASRVARLGRLSTMTAGIAGNMALNGVAQLGKGQRPTMRDLLLTPRNVTRVADQLAQMRGAAMKIGQLMSMDTGEVLPPELSTIMAKLRDNAHFMPPAQLKEVLNTHWQKNWLSAFQKFDVRPIAAASIGQVHRAHLKDGRELAIKVQYPGVSKSIDSDIANVGALMKMSGLLPKGFDIAPYLEEGRKQLHEETDYLREGTQLAQFGALLAHDPRFTVPQLRQDWSTSHILSMSYVAGKPVGLMQTDPNFANYQYQPETGRIVLLDFGATRQMNKTVAGQYLRLLRAGLDDNTSDLMQIALEIGFIAQDTKPQHQDQIIRMIQMVFASLKAAPLFDFGDRTMSKQMQAEGIKLAEDGFIPPLLPVDVLLLQRKFGGVFLLGATLGAKVDVVGLLETYLTSSFDT